MNLSGMSIWLSLVTLTSYIRVQVQVLGVLFPIQLLVGAPWRTVKDGPGVWAPASQVGYLNELLATALCLAHISLWRILGE